MERTDLKESRSVEEPVTHDIFQERVRNIYAMLDALNRDGFRRLDMAFFGYDDEVDPPPSIEH